MSDRRENLETLVLLCSYLPPKLAKEALLWWEQEGIHRHKEMIEHYNQGNSIGIPGVISFMYSKISPHDFSPSWTVDLASHLIMDQFRPRLEQELISLGGMGQARLKHLCGFELGSYAHRLSEIMENPDKALQYRARKNVRNDMIKRKKENKPEGAPARYIWNKQACQNIRVWAKDWYPGPYIY